jgi:predicted neuraminidase
LRAQLNIPPVSRAGTGALLSSEFIYKLESGPTQQCHASTIVETDHGLLAAWFGGVREKDPQVAIYVSHHDGQAWSKPVEVVDGSEGEDQEYACWNPVLFQPKTGPLMLFYKVGPNPSAWWGMLITSSDGGKTWSEPRRLGTDESLGQPNNNLIGPAKNKPIQLADGSILCPSSSEHLNGRWRIHFELSTDLGKTWTVIKPENGDNGLEAIQPSILTYPDGRMQVLCRSKNKFVATSWSSDGGKSWSAVTPTQLPNPNSGTDALTLADGRQLIAYNHTLQDGKFPKGRNMLNLALSDDGVKWKTVMTLEKYPREYSYPAVIQSKDGMIHLSYTWQRRSIRHATLDPAQLK